jgi:hypothetical protein
MVHACIRHPSGVKVSNYDRLFTQPREEIKVNINTLEIMEGGMSRRARALVLEWAVLHRAELRQAWELASRNQEPSKIAPLE